MSLQMFFSLALAIGWFGVGVIAVIALASILWE
jgi:hypothetical protein